MDKGTVLKLRLALDKGTTPTLLRNFFATVRTDSDRTRATVVQNARAQAIAHDSETRRLRGLAAAARDMARVRAIESAEIRKQEREMAALERRQKSQSGAARFQRGFESTRINAGAASPILSSVTRAGIAGAAGAGVATLASVGIAGAATAAARGVQLAGELEQSLNVLQAQSGATQSQMAAVAEAARELGADLSLPATSSTDAAQAMLTLVKAGLSVEDSMAAARGALQLAAASGQDVTTSAQAMGDALAIFGLRGGEAGRVADLLTSAVSATNGELGDFTYALRYAGPVAKGLGVPIEDLVTALGLLAQAGIRGEQAGTGLRTMLANLNPTSKEARAVMEALGVSAYDSQGKFVGLRALLGQFGPALAKTTDQQRAFALQTIFGKEAMNQASVVLGTSLPQWDALAKRLGEAGAATEQAAAKSKGFKGALDGLSSAFDTLLESKTSPFMQFLTSAVQMTAQLVNNLASAGDETERLARLGAAKAGRAAPSGGPGPRERLKEIDAEIKALGGALKGNLNAYSVGGGGLLSAPLPQETARAQYLNLLAEKRRLQREIASDEGEIRRIRGRSGQAAATSAPRPSAGRGNAGLAALMRRQRGHGARKSGSTSEATERRARLLRLGQRGAASVLDGVRYGATSIVDFLKAGQKSAQERRRAMVEGSAASIGESQGALLTSGQDAMEAARRDIEQQFLEMERREVRAIETAGSYDDAARYAQRLRDTRARLLSLRGVTGLARENDVAESEREIGQLLERHSAPGTGPNFSSLANPEYTAHHFTPAAVAKLRPASRLDTYLARESFHLTAATGAGTRSFAETLMQGGGLKQAGEAMGESMADTFSWRLSSELSDMAEQGLSRLIDALKETRGGMLGAAGALLGAAGALAALSGAQGKKKQRGGIFGGIVGAVAGSLLPGIGWAAGASIGANVGAGNWLGAIASGAGLKLKKRAVGGDVGMWQPTLIGESGPELFVPEVPGKVLTRGQTQQLAARLGGGGGTVANFYGDVDFADREHLDRVLGEVGRARWRAGLVGA